MSKLTTLPIHCLFALGLCEIFSSWWLWAHIPTDTIATYYPTAWSYIGEHLLIWLMFLVPFATFLQVTTKREWWGPYQGGWHVFSVIALAVLLELLSSCYRWYLAMQDGSRFPWWTGGLGSYLGARLYHL